MATATASQLEQLTGIYTIDPSHSRLGFVARHAMVTNAARPCPGLLDLHETHLGR